MTPEMAEKLCRMNGGLRSFRCSAKTAEGVDAIFEALVQAIYANKRIMERFVSGPKPLDDVPLQPTKPKSECC